MIPSIISSERLSDIQFSNDEIARYSRHLIMPEITMEGQKKLKAACVLCIGAGGLGSPIILYLAAAGIGRIGIVDGDTVDFSNLQRQILHHTSDVGRKKINSAKESIKEINPNIQVDLYDTFFTATNAEKLVEQYDILIDGTDNFPTRYLSNDISVFLKKPNIYGSIFRFDGQCTVFAPHIQGPCYRCLYPEPPPPGMVPSCAEGGVLGVLPGIIGIMQAIEAIKLIVGIGESLIGRLVHFDACKMKFREFNIRKDPKCPICSDHPTITHLIDYQHFCGINTPEKKTDMILNEITVHDLHDKLLNVKDSITLLDVREQFEWDIVHLPSAQLIPLGELHEKMNQLDSSHTIYVYCKSGSRSAEAVRQLQLAGFTNSWNIKGGILAWSEQIDSTMPKY